MLVNASYRYLCRLVYNIQLMLYPKTQLVDRIHQWNPPSEQLAHRAGIRIPIRFRATERTETGRKSLPD
jgi:hypothetical protein